MNRLGCGRGARGQHLALALAMTLASALANAEEPATHDASTVALAEQRAAEAFQAYERKDYAAAVALYLQAYEAAPSGSILYNIARIYDTKLADRPLAITFYRRYIADPGSYVERIEFANQRLKQLREAEAFSQQAGDERAAQVPSTGPPRAAAADKPRSVEQKLEQPSGSTTLRWTGIAFGAVGAAALGTAAGFGLSAMSHANTAKRLCEGNACSSQHGVDAAHGARTAATVSNILFLAGGGLLATGVTLFVVGGESTLEKSRAAAVQWSGQADRSTFTLEVSGKW